MLKVSKMNLCLAIRHFLEKTQRMCLTGVPGANSDSVFLKSLDTHLGLCETASEGHTKREHAKTDRRATSMFLQPDGSTANPMSKRS